MRCQKDGGVWARGAETQGWGEWATRCQVVVMGQRGKPGRLGGAGDKAPRSWKYGPVGLKPGERDGATNRALKDREVGARGTEARGARMWGQWD